MGSFSVLGNYLTYSVKRYLKSRSEMSVIDEQQQPVLCLCGSWRTQLTEFTRTVGLHFVSLFPALGQTCLLLISI